MVDVIEPPQEGGTGGRWYRLVDRLPSHEGPRYAIECAPALQGRAAYENQWAVIKQLPDSPSSEYESRPVAKRQFRLVTEESDKERLTSRIDWFEY